MLKKICDYCGEDATDEDYTVPMWKHARGGRGNVIMVGYACVGKQTINLCKACEQKVAWLFDEISKKY